MLQVLNLTAPSGIFTGVDELASDLLRLFGITDERLIKRTYSYELLSSMLGTSLTLQAWRDGANLTETEVYELTLPGEDKFEAADTVVNLFGLSELKGIIEVRLKVEADQLANLTVSFEPRKVVKTIDSAECKFTAKKVEYAETTSSNRS